MRTILKAGNNCWRIARAGRAAFIIDGEDYFAAVREALLLARGDREPFLHGLQPAHVHPAPDTLGPDSHHRIVADIQPADIELRKKILHSKLTKFAPLAVPEDVIEFLARTITRNVRELVGGLNKLIASLEKAGAL